jgi:flavin-dependent dehydrogenase
VDVDVAIAGGGPAGAAAALTLLRYSNLEVALIERSRYATLRVGESLPASAMGLLEYLGAWEAFVADRHPPTHAFNASWGSDSVGSTQLIFSEHGHGWHLDRRRFDATLAGLAGERGGKLLSGRRVRQARRDADGSWRLQMQDEESGQITTLQARHLIDASGRPAAIARRQGARAHAHDRLVAVVATYAEAAAGPGDRPPLIESGPQGWWYSGPLPDGRIVVAYFSDADLLRGDQLCQPQAWHSYASDTRHLRERLDGASLEGTPVVCAARSQLRQPLAGPGWVTAGEAAAAFDPLSSMGVVHALASGAEAARAAHQLLSTGSHAGVEAFTAGVRTHFARYRAQQVAYYRSENRWPESTFWKRRRLLTAMPA